MSVYRNEVFWFFLASVTSAPVRSIIAQMQQWHPVAWPVNDKCVTLAWGGPAPRPHRDTASLQRTGRCPGTIQLLVIFLRPKIIVNESAWPFVLNEVHAAFNTEWKISCRNPFPWNPVWGFPLCFCTETTPISLSQGYSNTLECSD